MSTEQSTTGSPHGRNRRKKRSHATAGPPRSETAGEDEKPPPRHKRVTIVLEITCLVLKVIEGAASLFHGIK